MQLAAYLEHWKKALLGGIYPENYLEYLRLNEVRFNRILKQFLPSGDFLASARQVSIPTHWIIITEPWCGDAAQSVPVLLKLIDQIPKATYSLVLRDGDSLIDSYLTRGGKSIPKVIIRNERHEDLFTWGPRPDRAHALYQLKKEEGVTMEDLHQALHHWYAKDKGTHLTTEIQENITKYLL
jgi:hypothetical protein